MPTLLSHRVVCLLGAIVLSTAASAQSGGDPCEVLGELTKYPVVSLMQLRSGAVFQREYEQWEWPSFSAVCARNIKHHVGDIGYMIASEERGTAVRFQRLPEDDYAIIGGGVFTGGGSVSFKQRPHPPSIWRTDTTGEHPAVSECRALQGGLAEKSTTLAAIPATHSLGSVRVPAGGIFLIDARGTDRPVIEMEDLVLEGAARGHFCADDSDSGGQLWIATDNVDENGIIRDVKILINVRGRVQLGHCYRVRSNRVILNVIGRGPSVRAEDQAAHDYLFGAVLAPERRVRLGTTDPETTHTQFSSVFAKQVSVRGEVYAALGCFDDRWADDSIFDE